MKEFEDHITGLPGWSTSCLLEWEEVTEAMVADLQVMEMVSAESSGVHPSGRLWSADDQAEFDSRKLTLTNVIASTYSDANCYKADSILRFLENPADGSLLTGQALQDALLELANDPDSHFQ
jgi:hypothetical protein